MTRITKNELIAINAALATENAALRAQLSAAKVQPTRRESASTGSGSGKSRRALACFWTFVDARDYIVGLKQRGCKVTLTAIRDDRGHAVVYAG